MTVSIHCGVCVVVCFCLCAVWCVSCLRGNSYPTDRVIHTINDPGEMERLVAAGASPVRQITDAQIMESGTDHIREGQDEYIGEGECNATGDEEYSYYYTDTEETTMRKNSLEEFDMAD